MNGILEIILTLSGVILIMAALIVIELKRRGKYWKQDFTWKRSGDCLIDEVIITMKNGDQYIGCHKYWYYFPSRKHCTPFDCDKLDELYKKLEIIKNG